jgi:uncharacterized membrane protein
MGIKEFIFLVVANVITCCGIPLLYPRITRRGLLFGVYVGEEQWDNEEARRITRDWQRGMILSSLISAGMFVVSFLYFKNPMMKKAAAAGLPPVLIVIVAAFFLRAYHRARALAAPGSPPPAAAAVLNAPETSLLFPTVVLGIGAVCGLCAVSYAAMHFPDLPPLVPTHFGPGGRPNVWRLKSFWTVMLSPLLTLITSTGLACMALLIPRAKRALRFPETQVSIQAQMRFRKAFTLYLCIIALVVTAMLTTLSIGSIRVGLGLNEALPSLTMVLAIGVGVWAIGGAVYLALRYGQGGARLERSTGNAPLTNGLADNRYWVLGMFYVNREDPSVFVEHRFGLGYTINFGNRKAVAFFLGFMGLILLLAIAALVKG